jgi:hypothetical protein
VYKRNRTKRNVGEGRRNERGKGRYVNGRLEKEIRAEGSVG